LEQFRGQLLDLMGTNTDFVEVFSAVGRAVGTENGIREVLNDAYVAVFGTVETEDKHEPAEKNKIYSEKNIPGNACLSQKILGFSYAAPLTGAVSDGFGYRSHPIEGDNKFHYGLDIEADEGAVITAFADGTVTAVGESSVLGKYVTLQHANGCATLYAHCSRITASSGQQVRTGDPIAEVGQTGQTTGPHLHFELQLDTVYVNPIYYVTE
jgi:murein DD-endopeptidase MepM/ murein hydrolase activator NlpD